MATPLKVRMRQKAVIKFLVAEGETLINIHKKFQTVYKDEALNYKCMEMGPTSD